MPPPKVDHTNTRCCICGRNDTYVYQGTPDWRRYYINGEWDGRSYICYYCRRVGIDKTKEYLDNKKKGRKCYICGGTYTYVGSDGRKNWTKARKYIKSAGIKDYICSICNSWIYNRLPEKGDSLIKSVANVRCGELRITATQSIGLFGEASIAKVRKLKILSIELDNLKCKFDLSPDSEYGIIQSKFRSPNYGDFGVNFGIEHNFDTLFVLCSDKCMKNIEKVYAIPESELQGIQGTTIVKNFSKYEKFRIDGTSYNDAYHSLLLFLNGRKYIGIEDIKKWLDE